MPQRIAAPSVRGAAKRQKTECIGGMPKVLVKQLKAVMNGRPAVNGTDRATRPAAAAAAAVGENVDAAKVARLQIAEIERKQQHAVRQALDTQGGGKEGDRPQAHAGKTTFTDKGNLFDNLSDLAGELRTESRAPLDSNASGKGGATPGGDGGPAGGGGTTAGAVDTAGALSNGNATGAGDSLRKRGAGDSEGVAVDSKSAGDGTGTGSASIASTNLRAADDLVVIDNATGDKHSAGAGDSATSVGKCTGAADYAGVGDSTGARDSDSAGNSTGTGDTTRASGSVSADSLGVSNTISGSDSTGADVDGSAGASETTVNDNSDSTECDRSTNANSDLTGGQEVTGASHSPLPATDESNCASESTGVNSVVDSLGANNESAGAAGDSPAAGDSAAGASRSPVASDSIAGAGDSPVSGDATAGAGDSPTDSTEATTGLPQVVSETGIADECDGSALTGGTVSPTCSTLAAGVTNPAGASCGEQRVETERAGDPSRTDCSDDAGDDGTLKRKGKT